MQKPNSSMVHATDPFIIEGGLKKIFYSNNTLSICYYTANDPKNDKAFWESQDTLVSEIPYFITQLCVIILLFHLCNLLGKYLKQPRFFAEILCSILIGPTPILGNSIKDNYIHPLKSWRASEVVANFSIVFYAFLVGLEMNLSTVRQIGKKAWYNAVTGILIALVMGPSMIALLAHYTHRSSLLAGASWAVVLSITSFPDLAQVLSELKLLHTPIGQIAISSAFVSEIASWFLFLVAYTLFNGQSFLNIIPTVGFILLSWFAIRPALSWVIRNTPMNGGKYSDNFLCSFYVLVMVFGFISDACGSNSFTGALMLGLLLPNGELAASLKEKVEDYMTGLVIPAYFLGIRFHLNDLKSINIFLLMGIVAMSFSAKIISTLIVTMFYKMPPHEGVILGFLMNTKGLFALIVINIGRDKLLLDNQTYSIMLIALLLMTIPVKIIPRWVHNSGKRKQHKGRTIERSKPDSELRVLVCVHTMHNLSGTINLLRLSNSTQQSPICIFVVHLVELSGRASAILIVHNNGESVMRNRQYSIGRRGEAEDIFTAFKSFENNGHGVSVHPMTAVSPYSSMHEDICNLAEDKRVTLILAPFHKQPRADGLVEKENADIKIVNQKLLNEAACSIGIFIDRGLGIDTASNETPQQVAVIFIGGPDDREALAYGRRLAGCRNVNLTVMRFFAAHVEQNASRNKSILIQGDTSDDDYDHDHDDVSIREGSVGNDRGRELDDEFVNEFKFRTMYDESITFMEKLVKSGDEIITGLRSNFDYFDLYIVGRGQGGVSTTHVALGLSGWTDCDELGPLGDTLSTADFAEDASILVIQQCFVEHKLDKATGSVHRNYVKAAGIRARRPSRGY